MGIRRRPVSDRSAIVADTLQAGYFRSVLTDQLATAEEDLANARARLAAHAGTRDQHRLSRMRREVRRRECEHNDLHRLITALDRRFGAKR